MADTAHIGVVGGGAWGTALACLARRAGRAVTLWSRDPAISKAIATERANPVYLPGMPLEPGIEAAASLDELGACDVLLLVCPAQAVRELAERLPGDSPVVICAKGIEAATGLLMPEVFEQVQPGPAASALLSGPSFAEEAIRGLPTAVSIATWNPTLGRDRWRRRWRPARSGPTGATTCWAWRWAARSRTCWRSPPASSRAAGSATTPRQPW